MISQQNENLRSIVMKNISEYFKFDTIKRTFKYYLYQIFCLNIYTIFTYVLNIENFLP